MIASGSSYLPKRKAILALADIVCVAGALLSLTLLDPRGTAENVLLHARNPGFLSAWLLFPVSFYVCGLYENERLYRPGAAIVPAVMSVCLGVLLGGTYAHATSSFQLDREVALRFALVLFTAIVFVRIAHAVATRRGFGLPRCLVVGTPVQAERVLQLIRRHRHAGLHLLGVVDPGIGLPRSGNAVSELSILGNLDALEALVAAHRIDRLIFAGSPREKPAVLRSLRSLRYRGIMVIDYVSLHEELAREIPLGEINDEWLFRAATSSSKVHIQHLKRPMDVIVSTLLMVPVAILVFPVVALLIKMSSAGPMFFRQERLGLSSRPFMLIKFRTMYWDAEKLTGPIWSTDNDPRITPVGRILRKFRIDELPQLINVLRGEMSLVGPRPERAVFTRKITASLPFFEERLLVRPGITGWAQVMAPYAASIEDSWRKLQFDLYYTKHMCFFLDALIFVKTAKTVIFGREREQGGMKAGQLDPSVTSWSSGRQNESPALSFPFLFEVTEQAVRGTGRTVSTGLLAPALDTMAHDAGRERPGSAPL